MPENKVTIYHPVVGKADVMESAVSAWLRKGWLLEPDATKHDLLPVREYEEKSVEADSTATVEE